MSWKLVLSLSMFGLAMAVATVFVIPSNIEPFFWLAIFLACAVIIAKRAPGKFFLHGLMTSLVNGVWITSAHVIFFDTYVANHVAEVEAFKGAPLSTRVMMLVTGPIIGLVSGLILGLFAFIASKIVKRPAAPA
jgi:hypothetical protein